VLTSRQIRQALLPRKRDLLDLAHIDSAKIRLRGTLWDYGYGDAVILDSSEINTTAHTAVLNVTIDPAHRTTIDSVVIEGNKGVSANTIRRLLDLHEGDLYRRSEMTAAQRRLYETEIFRQTLVLVPEVQDSAKTVTVSVREAPFRSARVGLGFNTTEFGQAEFRNTLYNCSAARVAWTSALRRGTCSRANCTGNRSSETPYRWGSATMSTRGS